MDIEYKKGDTILLKEIYEPVVRMKIDDLTSNADACCLMIRGTLEDGTKKNVVFYTKDSDSYGSNGTFITHTGDNIDWYKR